MTSLTKSFLIGVLLTAISVSVFGQEPKAILVTEFGLLPCEHILAQIDPLAWELQQEPAATAYILINPPSVRPFHADGRRKLISSTLQLRGVTPDRYAFYKGGLADGGEIQTRIWKLVPGAQPPVTDSILWAVDSPNTSRAFIFGYSDELDICPTFVPRAFARLILDNPGSRGNIVVTKGLDPMENHFYIAERWIKELVDKQGVPRRRLRLFFVKGTETGAEFWFVPARKK